MGAPEDQIKGTFLKHEQLSDFLADDSAYLKRGAKGAYVPDVILATLEKSLDEKLPLSVREENLMAGQALANAYEGDVGRVLAILNKRIKLKNDIRKSADVEGKIRDALEFSPEPILPEEETKKYGFTHRGRLSALIHEKVEAVRSERLQDDKHISHPTPTEKSLYLLANDHPVEAHRVLENFDFYIDAKETLIKGKQVVSDVDAAYLNGLRAQADIIREVIPEEERKQKKTSEHHLPREKELNSMQRKAAALREPEKKHPVDLQIAHESRRQIAEAVQKDPEGHLVGGIARDGSLIGKA